MLRKSRDATRWTHIRVGPARQVRQVVRLAPTRVDGPWPKEAIDELVHSYKLLVASLHGEVDDNTKAEHARRLQHVLTTGFRGCEAPFIEKCWSAVGEACGRARLAIAHTEREIHLVQDLLGRGAFWDCVGSYSWEYLADSYACLACMYAENEQFDCAIDRIRRAQRLRADRGLVPNENDKQILLQLLEDAGDFGVRWPVLPSGGNIPDNIGDDYYPLSWPHAPLLEPAVFQRYRDELIYLRQNVVYWFFVAEDPATALPFAERLSAHLQRHSEDVLDPFVEDCRAIISQVKGDSRSAREHMERELALGQAVLAEDHQQPERYQYSPEAHAHNHCTLAVVCADDRDFARARQLLLEAERLARASGIPFGRKLLLRYIDEAERFYLSRAAGRSHGPDRH